MGYRNLTAILLFLLLACNLHSQYVRLYDSRAIATDFNTCMQGVKDSTGHWLIQPIYETIEPHANRYMVSIGGKYGLLDDHGNVMVPLSYDYLGSADYWYYGSPIIGYYQVRISDSYGIIDSVNNIVVPIKYELVCAYRDSTFACRSGKKGIDIYNLQGTCFHSPWKTKKFPTHNARHTFTFQKNFLGRKRYGVLNDSAHVVLNRKYSGIDAYPSTSTLRVRKGKKYGFCSTAGRTIWPIAFSYPDDWWQWSMDYSVLGETGVGPAYCNGHWGLLNLDGDTLLPFIYDRITAFDADDTELWRVQRDSLNGVFDIRFGWVLKPECTEMITVQTYQTNMDSAQVGLFVAEQNGKWGIITTAGQQILPFDNDDMLQLSEESFVFIKGDSIFQFGLFNEWSVNWPRILGITRPYYSSSSFIADIDEEPKPAIPDSRRFNEYHGEHGERAFYNPDLIVDSSLVFDSTVCLRTGKTYGMRVPDSILISTAFYILPVVKPILNTQNFDLCSSQFLTDDSTSYHYMSFCVMHNHAAPELTTISEVVFQEHGFNYIITGRQDLLKTDGSIILSSDSIVRIETAQHGVDGGMFFCVYHYPFEMTVADTSGHFLFPFSKKVITDYSGPFAWCTNSEYTLNWQLIDSRTNVNILGKKTTSYLPYPIWDSLTITANEKNGVRLFNLNRRSYCTAIGFNEIVPLNFSGTLFAVKTCSQHIGVINGAGHFVLDTIYDAFTHVEYDTTFRSDEYYGSDYFNQFFKHAVFYNGTTSTMLDLRTGRVVSPEESHALLWNFSAVTIRTPAIPKALADSMSFYLDYTKEAAIYLTKPDSAALLPWQRQCIVDTLYCPQRDFSGDNYDYRNNMCLYCRDRGAMRETYSWEKNYSRTVPFYLEYHDDSLLSFSRINLSSGWDIQLNKSWFSNVMLFPDGAHQMTLDSLFNPASDWRNFIVNTLLNYVNSRPGINGNCHNPAGIPAMLNQNFQFTPQGLILYPPDFTEHENQLVLIIPWADAIPYLRGDLLSRLPIGPK